MGVTRELDYVHRQPGVVRRSMQKVGSTRVGAWCFSKTLPTMDRAVRRLSKGRSSAPEVLAGLPVLWVTTTGRKTGQARTTPLIAVPCGDDLALIGTNFGQRTTPAWVYNLEADPEAIVEYRGITCRATARPATETERDTVWQAASAVYGGYDKYQQRIKGRRIRIFVLESSSDGAPA
jgi:deazaflavin-dependent oxidoreductase (nitroreductase family)